MSQVGIGLAYRVSGGQKVGLLGPKALKGRPSGCMGVKGLAFRLPLARGQDVGQKGPGGSRGRTKVSQRIARDI